MRVACTTWDGGGNVVVFEVLAARLRERGHEVTVQTARGAPPDLSGDVLLVDHMTPVDGLEAVLRSGIPAATVVHTMWGFVPRLDGTFAPAGYLDLLTGFERNLVCSIRELDGGPVPANVRHVGPLIEPEGPDAGWVPPDRSLVVVTMGSHDLGDAPVVQRVLDGLADAPVAVVVTVRAGFDVDGLAVPPNAQVLGYTRHATLLPHADVFVGHAGHGGIMAALAFGVPMVLLPLDRDQPHNAAAVARAGAARVLDRTADAATIADAVEAVRTGERERVAAIALANAVAAYGDAPVIEVERLGTS